MAERRFRFRPPAVDAAVASPGLRWALLRAFGDPGLAAEGATGALEIAERLGLLPRIVSRIGDERLETELGAEAFAAARAARALAVARELRLDETLADLETVAARLGFEPVVLKGRALVLGGHSAPGARPSGDIDLLVPEKDLQAFAEELQRAGFDRAPGTGYEHQLPPLRHPHGELVELHRHLPGVRVAPRSFATWHDLSRSGLTQTPADGRFTALRVPARALLTAHALVHALAQHGLAAKAPGWLLTADLLDLDAASSSRSVSARPWEPWIERELSRDEIEAALALSRRAAAGTISLDSDDDVALLGRHFVACAFDAGYAEALKTRWLEAPVSERTRLGARARLLLRAFVPPPGDARGGRASRLGRARRWLGRPFELLAKALGAARAERRSRARKGEPRDPRQR